jgi:hypothetical protein
MPTPYDLYVRFLVTKGEDDIEHVNRTLSDLNLPAITQAVFDGQYSLVLNSVPLGIATQIEKKSYSVDFMKWMAILQVAELWDGERTAFTGKDAAKRGFIKLVYDIHQDIKLRTAINALLIKAVPPKDIIQAVNQRYSTLLREDHIVVYSKFFFEPKTMTRKAWRGFVKRSDPHEASVYFTALSESVDVVRTELELPAKLSTSESLQFLAGKVFSKAKSFLDVKTPEGGDEARKWVSTYLHVLDKYQKYRTGDSDDFASSLQMEFQFVDDEFLTPDTDVMAEITARMKKGEKKDEPEGGEAAS